MKWENVGLLPAFRQGLPHSVTVTVDLSNEAFLYI